MAFTPQPDGPYVVGANSYCDVEYFRAFWTDRDANRLTDVDDGQIQESLVNASSWIDAYPWVGLPTSDSYSEMRLAWPRYYGVMQHGNTRYRPGFLLPSDIVPRVVRDAVSIVAMEDLTERVNVQDDPREKLSTKVIGPIEKVFAAPLAGRRFPEAERLVIGFWKVRSGPPGAIKLINGGSGYVDDDRPPLRGERLTDLESGTFIGGPLGNGQVR